MSSIDQRVVQMQFDNAAFQRGVQQSLHSLEALNKSLNLQGAAKGLQGIGAAANAQTASLKNVEQATDRVGGRFSAMAIAATTALGTVVHQATAAGGRLVKSLTLDPVMQGFREYETNIGSIQTILANTGREGAKGLREVNAALDELNTYSDQTIYNFSEMARNIGTFTAAGVKLEVATAAIKGIANLAAVSGSNSEQASAAMYQLSQAISAGKVSLEDWNSVVNAGMGGKVFQNALMETARVHGVSIDKMVKKAGSFRLTLQEGWLTGEILTETLSKFTGDLTAAQLKTMGYNKKQIAGILKMGKTAQDAATKVKTVSQLINTLQEGVTSGWAKTWQLLFGDFNEAKTMFTEVGTVLGGFVDHMSDARNKVLGDWKALGGRTVLIEAIGNAFKGLLSFIRPIRDAFRQMFPATTGKQLYDLTVTLRDFTKNLEIGGSTAGKLKRTFAGIFAVFGIGWDIIKQVAKTFFELIGVATKGSGGFLNFTARIGDFLVKLRESIRQGEGLKNFFKGLGAVLAIPIKIIQQLGKFLGMLFKDVDGNAAAAGVAKVSEKLEPLGKIGEIVSKAWSKVLGVLKNVWNFFLDLGGVIADFFGGFSDEIANAVQGLNFQDIFAGINTGLFAGIVLMLRNLIGGGGAGGIMESLTDSLDKVTGALSAMQGALHAAALLQIAIAVGILALSMNTLSKIDAAGLTRASAAISVMFGQLLGSLVLFQKFVSFAGFAKMPFIMGSLILLAGAILVLSQSVKQLSGLNWNELAKGLVGVLTLLGGVTAAMKFMPNPAGLISTSIGIIALSVGIKILASAVEDLSGLSWEEMAKGLIGVGALLGALVLFTMFANANAGGIVQGVGIILLATGIKILASALKDMGEMSWMEIAKGLTAMAGGLVLIGAALWLIPPTAPLSAAGVLIVAFALEMIGEAVQSMGKMSWGQIAKGIVAMAGALLSISLALMFLPPSSLLSAAAIFIVASSLNMIGDALKGMSKMSWVEIAKSLIMLAGSLGIIAVAMMLMTTALPGAAALLIISNSLMILQPVLQKFGEMSWGEMLKSLLMLAGVFVVIGAAGLLLAPVVPAIIGLGVGITLLGAGMLLAGAGVLLFATALTALAASGMAATAAIVGIVGGLVGLIPTVIKQIGLGLIAFAAVIGSAGPAIAKAMYAVIWALIDTVTKLIPKITEALYKMLSKMLDTMLKYLPKMVDTGMKLITGVLEGISKNIGKLIDAGTKLCVNFLAGVARNLPKIIQAGVDLILKFINGVTAAIDRNSAALGEAGGRLAVAIVRGMVRGIAAGTGEISAAAGRVASAALARAKSILGIHSPSKEFEKIGRYVNDGFRKGLDGNRGQVNGAFERMKKMLLDLSKSSKATAKERAKARGAYAHLTRQLGDERIALGRLAQSYDIVTGRLKTAQETLANAIKTRDDYNKQVKDQYSDMPSATGETKLKDYLDDLKKQVEDTKVFANAIQRLKNLGLNNETLQDLIATGPSSLPFVEELLASGKSGVDEINRLDKELDIAGAHMGKTASTALYQAAVDSAAGLVKGLQNQQAAIEKQMDKIADAMVRSIKKKLGIKSPSRVFAEVGDWSAKGLAKGLIDASGVVEKSAADTGEKAVGALRKSLSGISDMMAKDVDLNPTIVPVMDLSNVKKSASMIGNLVGGARPIAVDTSYSKARIAAAGYMRNQDLLTPATETMPGKAITFNQYNNSPKALSSAEIYRQTKNQLSVAKGALTQ